MEWDKSDAEAFKEEQEETETLDDQTLDTAAKLRRQNSPRKEKADKEGKSFSKKKKNIFYKPVEKKVPTLRMDKDVASIPPSSKARHEFTVLFAEDIAKALQISSDMVEVISVKPAPAYSWLTNVEFNLHIYLPAPAPAHEGSETSSFSGAGYDSVVDSMVTEKAEIRSTLLARLHAMVRDPQSALYKGFSTSSLDPTFSKNLVSEDTRRGDEDEDELVPFSSDPAVLKVMNKYADSEVRLPTGPAIQLHAILRNFIFIFTFTFILIYNVVYD